MTVSAGNGRRVLIIVENLPVPFDRRVWQEATALRYGGYGVAVVCPKGAGYERAYESIEGIDVYRHPLPLEGQGALGYVIEYSVALFWEFVLAIKVWRRHGFDVIHACNPPDTIFILGRMFKLFGKRFVFDHHDINPELFRAKFGRRGLIYKLIVALERWTFQTADVCIATNESYREIAIRRGGVAPDRVFVVRSGPSLERLKISAPVDKWKQGRRYLVGYVGVMGKQEGLEYLLQAAQYLVREKRRQDVHFVLVGGGTQLDVLRTYATRLDLGEFVTFTGRAPEQVLLEVLNTADVCVNADVVNAMNDKSTMNKIMEYMALGKAIVQFELTEGRFTAREASLYAKPNDYIDLASKIAELLDDPVRREQMGRYGRERVEKVLAWKHEAPKLLHAYDTLFPKEA